MFATPAAGGSCARSANVQGVLIMLRSLAGWSLKFRLLVVTLAAGAFALGTFQLAGAQPEALPEIDPVHIEVQTEALGLSAIEVEQLITSPLEADLLNGVAFVDDIRSTSMPGLSSVVMVFEPGVPLHQARQLVQERLGQAAVALPNVSKPPAMLEPTSSAARIMVIGMSSTDLPLIDQAVLARWTIRPKLMGVPGVANVALFGERDRQLQVQVDPQRLGENGLSLSDIIATTGNATWASPLTFLEASTPGTGGFIDTPNQRLGVRHVSPISDAARLAEVAVDGRPDLRLGDVATVVEDHPLLIGDAVGPTPTDRSAMMIVIEKFPERNTLEVTRGVEQALESLRPGLPGITLDTSLYRPAGYLAALTGNVTLVLAAGIAAAAFVIALLFRAWRPAVIAIAVILVSLATAVAVVHIAGTPLNLLVLLGLVAALAVVIADALDDTQTVGRELRRRRDAGEATSAARTILESAVRTRGALIYATLIAAAALVPVLVVRGSLGALLTSFAVSYLVASGAALLVSLTLTPALSFLLLARSSGREARGRPPSAHREHATPRTSALVRRAGPAVAVAAVLLGAGAGMVPLLATSLEPKLAEPDVLIDFAGPVGTSRPEMSRLAAAVAAELRTVPGVTGAGAHIGRALMSDRVSDVNAGQLWVHLDPQADRDATMAAVTATLDGYPGADWAVSSYLNRQAADALAAPRSDLRVRVYGDDLAVLDSQAEQVRTALAGIEGLDDPVVVRRPLTPAIQVQVDLGAAQRFGLKPGDVRRSVATVVSGLTVGHIFERQKVFDVVVWGVPEVRRSVTAVENMPIDLPAGGRVRLGDVAAVTVGPVPATVQRESASRYLDVVASVDGRGHAAIAADAERALRAMSFSYGYRAELQTDYAIWADGIASIVAAGAAAAIVIFLLLQAAFHSWRLATLAFLALPAALSGGAVAAFLAGGVLTVGSLAGLLAVLALASRQVITLIRHYQQLEDDDHSFHRPALVAAGTVHRVGPILTTALATGVAMLPILVAGSIPGMEYLAPMAAVVLGGLVSTTVVALFVLPALYLRFAGRQHREEHLDLELPVRRPAEDLVATGRPDAGQPSG